ncbi:MAG: hypothetical protein K0Q67_877 [Cellvibrio sp.]|jgi:hypothetical protein|nr:hypothetical protein [Cellvibrio sp.]
MKKLFTALLMLGTCFSFSANAISIDLIANQSAVNIGNNIEVQVRISGLNDASAPSLGDYDVNFNYDSSLFSFSSIVWGDAILGNQLDLSNFGSLQESTSGWSWLRISELSVDSAVDLELLQKDEFTLFSVSLNAAAIGSGTFSLTTNAVGDAYGNDVLIDTINSTAIDIRGVSVPEPSSLLLLLLGLVAITVLRAKMSQPKK